MTEFSRKCTTPTGKQGYQAGYGGKCFTGPNAKLAADRMHVQLYRSRRKRRLSLLP